MRILVDHSGYDLLNIGDIGMLQSCVQRLQRLTPTAEISVICHDAGQLAEYCPGTTPVVLSVPRLLDRGTPRRVRRLAEFALKGLGPLPTASGRFPAWDPAAHAVQMADVVVASGGGYVTDSFFWHAAGVLRTLALAQRLGRPTAMFGQGLGPVSNKLLRRRAQAVLPRLTLLGLREAPGAELLLRELDVQRAHVRVTGDDALGLALGPRPNAGAVAGDALGVNLRVTGYTGVSHATARTVAKAIGESADGGQVIALPVSRYATQNDLESTGAACRSAGIRIESHDLRHPDELASQAARCRAVVTTSYHAGVFALAQGIPAVCLSNSSYYDAKFEGLRQFFPDTCTTVSLHESNLEQRLRIALNEAAEIGPAKRLATWEQAAALVDRADSAYRSFIAGIA
jgi:colanic acid/amylovoran biosynthesis protein